MLLHFSGPVFLMKRRISLKLDILQIFSHLNQKCLSKTTAYPPLLTPVSQFGLTIDYCSASVWMSCHCQTLVHSPLSCWHLQNLFLWILLYYLGCFPSPLCLWHPPVLSMTPFSQGTCLISGCSFITSTWITSYVHILFLHVLYQFT